MEYHEFSEVISGTRPDGASPKESQSVLLMMVRAFYDNTCGEHAIVHDNIVLFCGYIGALIEYSNSIFNQWLGCHDVFYLEV